jgi:hypothetical protein
VFLGARFGRRFAAVVHLADRRQPARQHAQRGAAEQVREQHPGQQSRQRGPHRREERRERTLGVEVEADRSGAQDEGAFEGEEGEAEGRPTEGAAQDPLHQRRDDSCIASR